MVYTAQKHLKPKALSGISDEQIDQHWHLYEAYVKNTNEILEELGEAESGSHHWSELKRWPNAGPTSTPGTTISPRPEPCAASGGSFSITSRPPGVSSTGGSAIT